MTVHVQQRGENDCGIAACAMAAGWTYEATLAEFGDWVEETEKHGPRGTDETHYRKFFKAAGIEIRGPFGGWKDENAGNLIRELIWRRRAVLSIHSLNNDGGYHLVYFDGRQLFDPQEGRPGKTVAPSLWAVSIRSAWIFSETEPSV